MEVPPTEHKTRVPDPYPSRPSSLPDQYNPVD